MSKSKDRVWTLFERLRGSKSGTRWSRTFLNHKLLTQDEAARKYQSYLLTGILVGEDGDPGKEYTIRSVKTL